MSDVGGKAFDGVHSLPQLVGHFTERSREIADFVAASGEVWYFDSRPTATCPLRGGGETANGPRNRAGEIERQQHRYEQRHAEYPQQFKSYGAELLLDLAAAGGQHYDPEHLFVALDRNGNAEHQAAD